MKTVIKALMALCLLWVIFAMLESLIESSASDMLGFWGNGALKEADKALRDSGNPRVVDGTAVTVTRGTLIMLKIRAEKPTEEVVYLLVSAGFALIAAISLFCLSRRQTHVAAIST